MTDSQQFSLITVSSDEDDDIVIHAGAQRYVREDLAPEAPDGESSSPDAESKTVQAAGVSAEKRAGAHVEDVREAQDAGGSRSEAAGPDVVSRRSAQVRSADEGGRDDAPAPAAASSKDDDLGLDPMPVAQKVIIVAAVLGIAAFIAYFVFFM